MKKILLLLFALMLLCLEGNGSLLQAQPSDLRMLTYAVDPRLQDLQLYWKDDRGQILSSIQNLKNFVEGQQKTLVFAMNAGMFNPDHEPQGLFIQHGKQVTPLDTLSGEGNFYLKPNGVFYLKTDSTAVICRTERFQADSQVAYATQSGPMLVIDGKLHPVFKKGSPNLHIRNGVGILPDGRAVFVMSKTPVNFYDFATYFIDLGCKNALYLDGSVSRTYCPAQRWTQTDGRFGPMIGVTQVAQK